LPLLARRGVSGTKKNDTLVTLMAGDGVVAQDRKDLLGLNHHPVRSFQRRLREICRGRNGDRSPPPARIRTYRFPISGSCLRSTDEAERFADSRQLTGQTRLAQCPEVCRAWPSSPWPNPFPPPPAAWLSALFGSFSGTTDWSDFPGSFVIGVCPWTSRCGLLAQPTLGSPSLRSMCFHACLGSQTSQGPSAT